MVRWAYDDPNPVAIDAIKRADQDIMYALLKAKGISVQSASFHYPAHYEVPEAKRLRLENGADVVEERPDLAYPNTDGQYPVSAGAYSESGDYYEQYAAQNAARYADTEVVDSTSTGDDDSDAGGWEKHVDESTGATYYFNTATGESSWVDPEALVSKEGITSSE